MLGQTLKENNKLIVYPIVYIVTLPKSSGETKYVVTGTVIKPTIYINIPIENPLNLFKKAFAL